MAKKPTPAETLYPTGTPTSDVAQFALLREHLDARIGGMTTDRMSFWTHWGELANYLIPRRYKWLITPNQANRGSPINGRIIDNTGTIALRVLQSGMMSGVSSPGRPWFRLTLDDPELREVPAVKQWLDEVTRRILTVFAKSNFYTSLATMYGDLGAFGTGVMNIREDFEDVIRCYNYCAGEYFLANSKRMEVNVCYRTFVMTVAQVVDEFGLANCSDSVKGLWNTKGASLSTEIIVAHAIEPSDSLTNGMGRMRAFPFREVFWEYGKAGGSLLSLRGLHEFSTLAPRWEIVGNDAYGRSPGMDALGDIKQLQVQQKRKAQAIDKMVNPPMMADPILKNEPATLLPGGVTYVQQTANSTGFKPVYQVDPKVRELSEDMKEVQARVRNTFYYDLFMMISQMEGVQPRNDLEIMERKEEKLIQLGPVLERFENEALDPAIDRTYAIMERAQLIPPMPRELMGQHVKPEYISVLALAQRAATTAGIERFLAFAGRVGAVVPEALDNIDTDEMIDQYADLMGTPANIVRPIVEVMKLREQRAKQQQAQAAMQAGMAAVQGAKVMSETPVGGGQSALSMMTGGGPSQ